VMVKNFTNINKTINYLSPQITEHKKATTHAHGNPRLGLRQEQSFGGVNPVNWLSTLPLVI